jgi:radical SAM superfamily enzyme YgiQ (UPF0313 family)
MGPGEETFSAFLHDFRHGLPRLRYVLGAGPMLLGVLPIWRNLIKRERYLVPTSLVVTHGCPHHCDFCYKDAFFEGGKLFYIQTVDDALAEMNCLPGHHLYFLDDHLLSNVRFAASLFEGMRGMDDCFRTRPQSIAFCPIIACLKSR